MPLATGGHRVQHVQHVSGVCGPAHKENILPGVSTLNIQGVLYTRTKATRPTLAISNTGNFARLTVQILPRS